MAQGIYKITNMKNQKVYIGQSVNMGIRHRQHWDKLRRGHHGNEYLQKDWNDNKGSFRFDIIEVVKDKNLLNERESYWVDFYNSTDRKKGYNIKVGGGYIRSQEEKPKYSKSK